MGCTFALRYNLNDLFSVVMTNGDLVYAQIEDRLIPDMGTCSFLPNITKKHDPEFEDSETE